MRMRAPGPLPMILALALFAPAPSAGEASSPFAALRGEGTVHEFRQRDPEIGRKVGSEQAYTIRYTRWRPAEGKGKVIVYNHGFQSHRGWFNSTARELAGQGFTVYAFDRIGSGESSGGFHLRRGRLSSQRGHIRDWRLFLDTLEEMLVIAGAENPGARIVLWGNSYGAKIVEAYLFDRAGRLAELGVAAAVFTSPGHYRNKESMPLPFSRMKLATAGGKALFPVPMVEHEGDNGAHWFVAPGEWFERIREDELSLREATRAFYMQTRNLDAFLHDRPLESKLPVPAFYLMVRDDVMMDNERMRDHIEHHGRDSLFKFYRGGPEAKHFLLFTPDRDEALGDILRFLEGEPERIEGAWRVRAAP